MISKIKAMLFPCEQLMKALRDEHAQAVSLNTKAHESLRLACGDGYKTACGDFVPKANFAEGKIPRAFNANTR